VYIKNKEKEYKKMKYFAGRRFIPSYVLCYIAFAVVTPYLSILMQDLGYSPFWVGILLGIFEGSAIAGPFYIRLLGG